MHVKVYVEETPKYRDRMDFPTQNSLVAYSFDLKLTDMCSERQIGHSSTGGKMEILACLWDQSHEKSKEAKRRLWKLG